MNIDSGAIRRVRDHLLEHPGFDSSDPAGRSADREVLRRLEPFAELMYLVMMADGQAAAAERQALGAALALLCDGRVGAADIDAMLDGFSRSLQAHGVEGRLARIGAGLGSDRENRETAFTLAAATALADDAVDARESGMLRLVQTHLGLSDRRTAALLDAVD